MCAFDVWVKEAETVLALTETLNDVVDVDVVWPYVPTHVRVRPHRTNIELMEVMVGYTLVHAESAINRISRRKLLISSSRGWATATPPPNRIFEFLVRFLRASLCQKEHALLLPWAEKLDAYGHEVHKLVTTHSAPGRR
jgi:hypothetical protein